MTLEPLASDAFDLPSPKVVPLTEAALETTFKDYFKPLCAYCHHRFGLEIDLAKEAVHTGFIRLWENRGSLSPELSVKAYLYKIITNICLDLLKHEKVKQRHYRYVLQNTAHFQSPGDAAHPDLKQLGSDIDKAVSELPAQMRRIFELSRYEGLKYAEISCHLGISIKTVETQMSRALLKLRQKLSHYLTLALIALLAQLR